MEITVPERIDKNQPVTAIAVPLNVQSIATIDFFIKDLQRIKEQYKEKTLYWEIDFYQDEDERSIILYEKIKQTDEEYHADLLRIAGDIETHTKFQVKRAEAFRDYVRKVTETGQNDMLN